MLETFYNEVGFSKKKSCFQCLGFGPGLAEILNHEIENFKKIYFRFQNMKGQMPDTKNKPTVAPSNPSYPYGSPCSPIIAVA